MATMHRYLNASERARVPDHPDESSRHHNSPHPPQLVCRCQDDPIPEPSQHQSRASSTVEHSRIIIIPAVHGPRSQDVDQPDEAQSLYAVAFRVTTHARIAQAYKRAQKNARSDLHAKAHVAIADPEAASLSLLRFAARYPQGDHIPHQRDKSSHSYDTSNNDPSAAVLPEWVPCPPRPL